MHRLTWILCCGVVILFFVLGCPATERTEDIPTPNQPGLLLALATFTQGPNGPTPDPARLGILRPGASVWTYDTLEDPDSNVFHKAMVLDANFGKGILTAGGTAAVLKLWSSRAEADRLWEVDFGGTFSRFRDIEVADVLGTGQPAIVVATHDQGVVALVSPAESGGYDVTELDREPNTFVHEIEIGDLDGDGVNEIYATPSQPNRLDGTAQSGVVVRYVPAAGEGRKIVADLGDRHAKEILVDDVDGDGTVELYVSVEAVSWGLAEVLRFDADTPPDAGVRVATLSDKLCRCLTAGDLDGDGKKELVATTNKGGVWLLRPPQDEKQKGWSSELIDASSSGFEHAALIADLDGDGIDELYVANDDGAEVNRYRLKSGAFDKETIYTYPEKLSGFTWNMEVIPAGFEF
jgi:hypothetical protein